MRYRASLLIPAGTLKENPATKEVILAAGVITEVEIFFPPGHGGTTNLAIYRQEHQLWPTSPDEAFIGDDTHITINERYELDGEPYSIELRGWSPNATLDHTVYVGITLESLTMERVETVSYISLPEGLL